MNVAGARLLGRSYDGFEQGSVCSEKRIRPASSHGRVGDANQVWSTNSRRSAPNSSSMAAGSAAAAGAGHDLRRPTRAARRHHHHQDIAARSACCARSRPNGCAVYWVTVCTRLPGWHLVRGIRLATTDGLESAGAQSSWTGEAVADGGLRSAVPSGAGRPQAAGAGPASSPADSAGRAIAPALVHDW